MAQSPPTPPHHKKKKHHGNPFPFAKKSDIATPGDTQDPNAGKNGSMKNAIAARMAARKKGNL